MKSLTQIAILIALILCSCSKENSTPTTTQIDDYVQFIPIGQIHNELLTNVKTTNANRTSIEFEIIGDVIDHGENFVRTEYPDFYLQYPRVDVKSNFEDYRLRLSEYNVVQHLETTGLDMVNQGSMPESFYNFLLQLVNEEWPYDLMIQKLEEYKTANSAEIATNNDLNLIILTFEDMAYHSNEFWMNYGSQSRTGSLRTSADNCDWGGYIADAAVGALFFWNPVAAIIGGFAASYIAEENCRQ